mmetsp:Transcript_28707/g.85434  ORF Transcript_28707/g.85434 Transcript_28707/m.85434 type:complete len:268 (+) Transcript_28707:981-1784(+)
MQHHAWSPSNCFVLTWSKSPGALEKIWLIIPHWPLPPVLIAIRPTRRPASSFWFTTPKSEASESTVPPFNVKRPSPLGKIPSSMLVRTATTLFAPLATAGMMAVESVAPPSVKRQVCSGLTLQAFGLESVVLMRSERRMGSPPTQHQSRQGIVVVGIPKASPLMAIVVSAERARGPGIWPHSVHTGLCTKSRAQTSVGPKRALVPPMPKHQASLCSPKQRRHGSTGGITTSSSAPPFAEYLVDALCGVNMYGMMHAPFAPPMPISFH